MKVNDLILSIYEDFGFKDIVVKFRRGRKRRRSDEVWDKAEAALGEGSFRNRRGQESVNPGEGAF